MASNNYSQITNPYNSNLEREGSGVNYVGSYSVDGGVGTNAVYEDISLKNMDSDEQYKISNSDELAPGIITGEQVDNLTIDTYIKSAGYVSGSAGFFIDGKTGNAEFNDVDVRGNLLGGKSDYDDNSDGFFIGSDGGTYKMYVGNATDSLKWDGSTLSVTGTITATAGSIGGWDITATTIQDVAGVVGMSSAVTAGDDIRFWAGHATPSSAPFYVTEAGNLTATSATITGSITATSGAIGGWVITSDALKDAAGTVGMLSTVTGGDDIRFFAGNTTPSSAPFSVTEAGVLTASSGTVGGWTLSSTSLSGGSGSSYIGLKPGTGIQMGSSTFSSAPFSVTNAGVLKAISGTIGGCTLASTSIGSTTFVSGPLGSGWNISNTGTAEFQDVSIRGVIRTSVFEKDTISAVNGIVLVSKSDVLDSDMTALDASTLTISGDSSFVNNEVIRIKDGTDDEWMLVTDASGAPTYVVTRDLAGDYTADNNPAWAKGTAVVSMGVGTGTKTGYVLIDSSSANSPFVDVYGRNSNTYSDTTLHARIGWLKGITDADVGLATTDVWGIYTDNAYIKGTLVADTGYIGGTTGWVIATGKITSTGIGVATAAGDATYAFWAGNDTPANAEFSVAHTGALVATSATITGSITATSGAIGGWVVTSDAMKDATGTVGMSSAVTAGDDIRFWAGHATPSSAPFYVTEAGNLTATSATITGAITATSGAIGSFTIGTYLYTGSKTAWNDTNAGVHIGSDGIGIGNNVFTVDGSSGALVATSATITGDITATTGYFDTVTLGKTGVASGTLTLELNGGTGDTYINAGKVDFTNTDAGFIMGIDDSDADTAKLFVGNTTNYLNWDGIKLIISGDILNIDSSTGEIQGEISVVTQQTAGEAIEENDTVFLATATTGAITLSSQTNSSGLVFDWGGTGSYAVGQLFQVGVVDKAISRIQLSLQKVGLPTDNLTVTIYSDNAGQPGSLLATSAVVDGSTLTTGDVKYDFDFTAINLTASTTYWVLLHRSGAQDAVNYYQIRGNSTGATATERLMRTFDDVTWSTIGGYTCYFKAIIVPTSGYVYKASGLTTSTSNTFLGFSVGAYPINSTAIIQYGNIDTSHSGLTIGSIYYLSDTYGAISTTAGTVSKAVGRALSATELQILYTI